MLSTVIHQATAHTSWRILSLLRLGQRRICVIKRAMEMTESAFSHALRKLERAGLVTVCKTGREKQAALSHQGRIVFSNIQALCFMLHGTDGTSVEDDTALIKQLRALSTENPS